MKEIDDNKLPILAIYKGNTLLRDKSSDLDYDFLLKVSGTDPIYLLVNADNSNKKLYTFTPDANGMIKVKFTEPVKSITAMFDWTTGYWSEYNLNLPSNYGDRFLLIVGFNNFIRRHRVEVIAEPFWDNHNLIFNDNLEYLPTSNATQVNRIMSSPGVASFDNITSLDLSAWDLSKATVLAAPFCYLSKLAECKCNWDTSHIQRFEFIGDNCSSLETLDISSWDTRNATSMANMFNGFNGAKNIIVGPNFKTTQCTNLANFYHGCTNLTNPPYIDTSNCIQLNNLFMNCQQLVEIPWAIDAAKCYMYNYYMLVGCPKLQYVVIKNIGTTTQTNIQLAIGSTNQWGAGSTKNRQSLVDTLLTYSNDRKSKGMATATITIGAANKARLTSEEITAIEAKGYLIK